MQIRRVSITVNNRLGINYPRIKAKLMDSAAIKTRQINAAKRQTDLGERILHDILPRKTDSGGKLKLNRPLHGTVSTFPIGFVSGRFLSWDPSNDKRARLRTISYSGRSSFD